MFSHLKEPFKRVLFGDGWLCRDIGARKKARWLKRVKGGSAEICVAKEEGDRWLSFSMRGSLERCRLHDGWIIE